MAPRRHRWEIAAVSPFRDKGFVRLMELQSFWWSQVAGSMSLRLWTEMLCAGKWGARGLWWLAAVAWMVWMATVFWALAIYVATVSNELIVSPGLLSESPCAIRVLHRQVPFTILPEFLSGLAVGAVSTGWPPTCGVQLAGVSDASCRPILGSLHKFPGKLVGEDGRSLGVQAFLVYFSLMVCDVLFFIVSACLVGLGVRSGEGLHEYTMIPPPFVIVFYY